MSNGHVKPTRKNFKDIEGQRFGKLLVVEYAGIKGTGSIWKCKCDCGCTIVTKASDILAGKSTQCVQCGHDAAIKHGGSRSLEYRSYSAMIMRCSNPTHPAYKRYAGRGIVVCQRWLESFDNFRSDMGPRPSKQHTLDRIDNDGNYEPENCRWAEWGTQMRNKRDNRIIECDGISLTAIEWSERTGIPSDTLRRRLDKYGWSVQKATTTPPRPRARSGGH